MCTEKQHPNCSKKTSYRFTTSRLLDKYCVPALELSALKTVCSPLYASSGPLLIQNVRNRRAPGHRGHPQGLAEVRRTQTGTPCGHPGCARPVSLFLFIRLLSCSDAPKLSPESFESETWAKLKAVIGAVQLMPVRQSNSVGRLGDGPV